MCAGKGAGGEDNTNPSQWFAYKPQSGTQHLRPLGLLYKTPPHFGRASQHPLSLWERTGVGDKLAPCIILGCQLRQVR